MSDQTRLPEGWSFVPKADQEPEIHAEHPDPERQIQHAHIPELSAEEMELYNITRASKLVSEVIDALTKLNTSNYVHQYTAAYGKLSLSTIVLEHVREQIPADLESPEGESYVKKMALQKSIDQALRLSETVLAGGNYGDFLASIKPLETFLSSVASGFIAFLAEKKGLRVLESLEDEKGSDSPDEKTG
jgi:hypothetical protein